MASINIIAPGGVTGWPGYERRRFRVSWGAIFAGVVVAAATNIVLTVLGIAIGSTVWDRGEAESIGIGAVVWTLISLLISLFVGGLTAGRMAGLLSRRDSRLHGIVMWSVFTLLMLWIMSMGLGTIAGSTFGFLGQAATTPATGAEAVPMDSLRVAAESLGSGVVRNQEEITGAVSRGAWATLALMALSIGAAVLGAAAGAPRIPAPEQRAVEETPRE
jgi:hypothetical protein